MKNANDIVFSDGSIIKAGCLEYHGSHYLACDDVVYEFTETAKKDDEGGSFLLLLNSSAKAFLDNKDA